MNLESLLADVEPRWHQAFVHFVHTGEAPPEFLHYLDRDEAGQRAVERAFTAQVEALEGLAQAIKRSDRRKLREEADVDRLSAAIARAVERVVELPREERREVLADAAATLASRAGTEGTQQIRSTLSALEREVATFMAVSSSRDE